MTTKADRAWRGKRDVDKENSISTFLFLRRFLLTAFFTLLISFYLLPNQAQADGLGMCDLSVREKATKVSLRWSYDGSESYTIYRSTQGPESGFSEIAALFPSRY